METLCNGAFMAFIKIVKGFLSNFMRTHKTLKGMNGTLKGLFKLLRKTAKTPYTLHCLQPWFKHANLSKVVCSLRAGVSLCLFDGF